MTTKQKNETTIIIKDEGKSNLNTNIHKSKREETVSHLSGMFYHTHRKRKKEEKERKRESKKSRKC